MPTYPTPSAYQEAVQFPEDAFHDPALQHAYPDENALGLPQPITGNFAAVFPMTEPTGQRWAVKCFLTEVSEQQRHYQAIAAHLEANPVPHLIDFTYQERGIVVNGTSHPILKMEWADGVPLNRFVAEHLDAPDRLAQVSEAWATALAALDDAEIAHGDLQHGNVLVRLDEGVVDLTFVDYDAMVVPGHRKETSPEVGHRNYQHPDRTEEDMGPYLDRFPGLVIFTALRACIARPELWARFDTGENMLFRDADFYDPSAAALFQELRAIDALSPLVDVLQKACYIEPEAVPRLEAVRAGTTQPDWYAAASTVAERRHAQRRPVRTGWARWFLPAVLGMTIVSIVLLLIGYPIGAAGLLAIGGGSAVWQGWRKYQRVSVVRRRRRLDEEVARFDTLLHNLKRQIESLRAKKKAVQNTVDERRAHRLEEVREEAIFDRLKHHFIGEVAGVEGVTHKHVVRLKKAGIRTAYEAKPERLARLRTVGDRTAARIGMWRAALIAEQEEALPEELSPAEERRIQRYVERRVNSLDAEIARAREKIRVQRRERQDVLDRRDEVPALSFGRYLLYLLRLGTLPSQQGGEPSRSAPAREAPSSPGRADMPAPSTSDEGPWWLRTG